MRYLPAGWHVTLHFIGNVDAHRVGNLAAAAALPSQPFELVLDQPGSDPGDWGCFSQLRCRRPREALYDRLGNALRGLDFRVESRPYLPYVTLERRAEAAIAPKSAAPVVW